MTIQLRHFLPAPGRDEADHVRLHHAAGGINKNVHGNAQLAAWLDSSGKPVISGKNDTTMITVGVSDPATAMKLDMIAASLASVGTSRDEHTGSEKASADSSTKTMALIAIVVAAGVGLAEVLTKPHQASGSVVSAARIAPATKPAAVEKAATMIAPRPKLPPGLEQGMKIVTNKNYAVCNPRKPYRTGVIVGGSNSALGPCVIHLDGDKLPRAMTLNLFDVVK